MSEVSQNSLSDNQHLRDIISVYMKKWKWFAFSTFCFILLAFIYLRYATPEYLSQAKIQIVVDQSAVTGLDLFKEVDIFSGGSNTVLDEIQIINSRSNFVSVVRELGLNTKIYTIGNIRDSEIYDNPPVKLNFIAEDSIINNADFEFFLNLSSSTTFGYSEVNDGPMKIHAFGKNLTTPVGDIVITPDLDHFEDFVEKKLRVTIKPINWVAQNYQTKVIVANSDEYSNIVSLSLEDPVMAKGKDIINALIRTYNKNAIEDKRAIADRTSSFIDERIADIATNLSNVDQSAEDLKTSRKLTDISSEANINLKAGSDTQQALANYRTQLNIAASMQDLVEQQDGFEVFPGNLGLDDPTIASTTQRYNQLVLERQRLLKSSTERSPIIQNLDQELLGLKQTMQSSLNSMVNNLGLQVNTLSNQQAIINSRIYSAPGNERALRDITRQQQTTESLYLYLLQKREEAQIAVASTAPKSRIIDLAYNPSDLPVSPKKRLIYLASLVFGFLVPFSFIYVNDILDDKLHNMHSLEKLTHDIPVLGELPRLSKKEMKMVARDDRSVLSEALRIIRTNLDYLLKTGNKRGNKNVVFVTSGAPGEGKTFLSINLAMILASTQKKVLLIGADIRNPKFYSFFTGDQIDKLGRGKKRREAGLTEYIYDSSLLPSDIINSMLVHKNTIDVIYSGKVPPNPAELLLSDRIKLLIEEMSDQYDYVVVDTAPLMVVTDTLLISNYADLIIYVTRADVTEKRSITFPMKLKAEGKMSHLCFIVNDVKASNLGYRGKYGYGYGKSARKWWQV